MSGLLTFRNFPYALTNVSMELIVIPVQLETFRYCKSLHPGSPDLFGGSNASKYDETDASLNLMSLKDSAIELTPLHDSMFRWLKRCR